MSAPDESPKHRNWHGALRLSYYAAFVTVVFLLVVTWAKRRDHPSASASHVEGTINYLGHPVRVILDCTCPNALVERRTQTLRFKATLSGTFSNEAVSTDYIDASIDAGSAAVDPQNVYVVSTQDLYSSGKTIGNFAVKITPPDDTLESISFDFFATDSATARTRRELGSVTWPIRSEVSSWTVLAPWLYGLLAFGAIAAVFITVDRRIAQARQRAEARLIQAKERADANPGEARFAWDLAKAKLEAYFDRNLTQVNLVFWLAVFVMAVGFGFVLAGVVLSYRQPEQMKPALVAAISGIITQFIGATFMVIYRSTMAQANEFMSILERINNAGMAVQVLDALPEGTDQKNTARATISALLVGGTGSGISKAKAKDAAAGTS